jgi:hypothetical protein
MTARLINDEMPHRTRRKFAMVADADPRNHCARRHVQEEL